MQCYWPRGFAGVPRTCLNTRIPYVDCSLPPHQTGLADFPHPAYPKIFAGGMHEVNCLACQRIHRLGDPRGIGRLMGASSMWNDSPPTTIQIRQGPFARPALPGVNTIMSPSDSPKSQETVIDSHRLLADQYASSANPLLGVSQVSNCSVDARCPQSPRSARRLHTLVASPPVRGFALSEGLATAKCVTRLNQVHLRYG